MHTSHLPVLPEELKMNVTGLVDPAAKVKGERMGDLSHGYVVNKSQTVGSSTS